MRFTFKSLKGFVHNQPKGKCWKIQKISHHFLLRNFSGIILNFLNFQFCVMVSKIKIISFVALITTVVGANIQKITDDCLDGRIIMKGTDKKCTTNSEVRIYQKLVDEKSFYCISIAKLQGENDSIVKVSIQWKGTSNFFKFVSFIYPVIN